MAFDRFATGVITHAKAILIAWVIILLVAAPFALMAGDKMLYDMDEMAVGDSESVEGMDIMDDYFPSSSADMSSSPMLVLYFEDETGQSQVGEYIAALNQGVADGRFTDEDGSEKVAAFVDAGMTYTSEDGYDGISVVIVMYSADWDGDLVDDTPELRSQIKSVIADYEAVKASEGNAVDFQIKAYLTGTSAIGYDTEAGAMDDVSNIDVFTILTILILVGLFFRSFITSATPPVVVGVGFVVTLAVIYGLAYLMDIFFVTEMLLIVSMFGAGCDYCIFILARYREERKTGRSHEDALHSAIAWAGESISISATAVIIGFGSMSICSFSMVSTMGICLAIGILVALMAALTLIPSILVVTGDRLFWPTRMKEYEEGGKATRGWFAACSRFGARYFESSSKFALKHAKAIVAVAIVITIPAAYVAMTAESSYDLSGSMLIGESDTGMDLMGEYADAGMIYPNYIIVEYDESVAEVTEFSLFGTSLGLLTWSDGFYTAGDSGSYFYQLQALAAGMMEDENISSVDLPFIWSYRVDEAKDVLGDYATEEEIFWYIVENSDATTMQVLTTVQGELAAMGFSYEDFVVTEGFLAELIDYEVNYNAMYVGGDFVETGSGSVTYVMLSASTHEGAMSNRSMDSIEYMRNVLDDFSKEQSAVVATWLTGSPAIMYDISEVIGGEFTLIEVLVVVLILILLFIVMRSYVIPFRSVLTILMSIMWTLGLTYLIFGDAVTWIIPLILLVICLGLGMDYDILLTTRIRENVTARGMTNDEAIHHAVTHSGSVITICGLIMGCAFGTLMMSSMGMLEQMGFALCFAILADALVVRTYVVPAVMHLLGDYNWKGPKFMNRKGSERGPRPGGLRPP